MQSPALSPPATSCYALSAIGPVSKAPLRDLISGCFMAVAWLVCPVAAAADEQAEQRQAGSRGRQLLGQYHCGTCHTIPGVAAARSTVAADLSGYGRRAYLIGRWPNRQEPLARWIADPAAMAPGTLMPSMGVSPADARDMAAYLLALRE